MTLKYPFKIFVLFSYLLIASFYCFGQKTKKNSLNKAGEYWWEQNNLRVIQTNLPGYEAATLNPDSLVKDLENFSANTLIINAGGIMAFYPTKLDFHYTNPDMKSNMLSEVIEKCHQKGIKVIVRFDFSRVHESIFKAHADWCYISSQGERIINTDMYVVSINAPYVQDRSFKIIKEVLDLYPVDGIFLNMPGYLTKNHYDGKYHGIDQNEYDKKRFFDYSKGMLLPTSENKDDSIFQKYLEFKEYTVQDWSRRLYEVVKSKGKNIAICTYLDKHVDIIRHESQTNSLPYWPYTASDNVANASNSYPDHIISNASIQQISFQSRYNAIEPEEVAIRLYENIANGSGLDISMMGDLRGYEDERNFETIKKVYAHHKKFEPYFGRYSSVAKIAVVAPGTWPSGEAMQEYRGILLMLKEAHIQFDIIEDARIGDLEERINKYKVIILPEITYLNQAGVDVLKRAVAKGISLIATNRTFSDNPKLLSDLFAAKIINKDNDGSGNYLSCVDRKIFHRLDKQSMVSWKFNLGLYDFSGSDERYLPILDKGRPGPPEIIGGHTPTGNFALGVKKHGNTKAVLLPINIGKLYYLHGYEQHKNIFLDVLDYTFSGSEEMIETNAHERVELILQNFIKNTPDNKNKNTPDGSILHLINVTGFSGNTYFRPLSISNISFRIKLASKPSKVFTMVSGKKLPFEWEEGYVSLTLDNLEEFEGIIFEN